MRILKEISQNKEIISKYDIQPMLNTKISEFEKIYDTNNKRIVVLNVETTGLFKTKGDRVIEIGCVEIENNTITGKY